MGMTEDENEMTIEPDETEPRYVIDVRRIGGPVWVVDLLAGESAPPVAAFGGPQALQQAEAECDRMNAREARAPLAGKAPAADARRRRLEHMLGQAMEIQDEALRQLAADAAVLDRAVKLAERLRRQLAEVPETGLSGSLTGDLAEEAAEYAWTGSSGSQDRSERAERTSRFERGSVISRDRLKAALKPFAGRGFPFMAPEERAAIRRLTQRGRCACGASAQLSHDCETSGRIS